MEDTKIPNISFRNCEVMQYCEFHSFIKDRNTLETYVNNICSSTSYIKQCVYILHDKDKEDSSHFHIFLKFDTPVPLARICKAFNVAPQYVGKIKGKFADAITYASHRNAPEKYQYDFNELFFYNMSLEDYIQEVEKVENEKLLEKKITLALYNYGDLKISKNVLFSDYLTTAELFSKFRSLYNKMVEFRSLNIKERSMNVLYITGVSGGGKTTFAKYISKKFNYDYFVSGTGDDILDGYDKEECIILDDFRSSSMPFNDLLKFTDNNTNSSVKSRFHNKDISNCKLMIITSIKRPLELYDYTKSLEPFKQLSRRFKDTYYYILDNKIYQYLLSDDGISYFALPYDMNYVFKEMNINFNNDDDILEKIFNLCGDNNGN